MAEYDALDRMSRTLRGSNPLPPRSPAGNMADDLVRNARQPRPAAPSTALVLTAPNTAPPPAAPSTALVRTADVGNNGYKPNFTMGGNGSPARQMPEGLRPGEAAELSQNARAQAAARAQARTTSGLLDEASAATRAASEAARPGVAPGAAPAAAAPSTASKFFGSADDWKNALKGPADSPHKTLRLTAPEAPGKFAKGLGVLQGAMGAKDAYDGIQEGDNWKAGVGAADAVAGAALFTPAAPAAGAYLGLRGAWDGAQALGGAINDHVLSEGAKDTLGGWVNQIGLNTGLWGVDDSAKMQMDAEQRLRRPAQSSPPAAAPAAAPSARPDPRNPYADANARKIAESDAQNAAADAQARAQAQVQQNREAGGGYDPNQSRPDLGYGPIGDRTKLTNEQAAIMNPQGRVTATGRAADGRPNSFSGVNVSGEVSYIGADGKALAGGGLRGEGFSNFDVAPAGANVVTGPNGSYAFATSGPSVRSQEQVQADIAQGKQQVADQAQQLGVSVAGMTPAQALKYMQEVRQARAINASQREAGGGYGGRADARGSDYLAKRAAEMKNLDYDRMSRSEVQARIAQYQTDVRAYTEGQQNQTMQRGQDITAGSSRYGHDTSFAGTKYSADAQLGGKQMETQQKLRQQQLMSGIYQAAGGDPVKAAKLAASYGIDPKQFTDMANAEQTRAKANSEDARNTFDNMFTDKDGNRDERAEAQAHQLASRIVPGWENMNPEQRNANRAKVVDAMRTVQGMNKLRNNGWGHAIGWDKPIPEYSQLPDLDGATVGDVGFLEGAARKDISKNDTKITLRNGEVRYLPAGTLSEAQLRMMQDNGATRSTR